MLAILLDPRPLPNEVINPLAAEVHTFLVSTADAKLLGALESRGFLSPYVLTDLLKLGWLYILRRNKQIVGVFIAYPTSHCGLENTVDPRLHLFDPCGTLLYVPAIVAKPTEPKGEPLAALATICQKRYPLTTKAYGWRRENRLMRPIPYKRLYMHRRHTNG